MSQDRQQAQIDFRAGRFDQAEARLLAALRQDPGRADLLGDLAGLRLAQGRLAEAEQLIREVIARHPRAAMAHNNLGIVLRARKRAREAIEAFGRALALQPDYVEAQAGRGECLMLENRVSEGRAAFDAVLARAPDHWLARWSRVVGLPIVSASEAEMAEARARFAADLDDTAVQVERHLDRDAAKIALAIGYKTNFFLHYQGENDRELQARYGALLTRVARAIYPEFTAPRPRRILAAGDRIRVGFVSAFFYGHSIAKTHGGWITGLPRDRFEVSVFHVGTQADAVTERLRQHSRFHDCGTLLPRALVERIAGENLDVLIWPDLGMTARLQLPSALRLAPVQANGLGHPITSGLPEMDYALSSELMEPADADGHYTERLVRMPNLSFAYPRPPAAAGQAPDGLARLRAAGRVLYLCAQSLFKMVPENDRLFAAVARAVPDAVFLFVSHEQAAVTEAFHRRLAGAFSAAGVPPEGRVHMLPRLTQDDFFALNAGVDVVLDSVGWSGCNSTLEAVAFDRPVVTLPGRMMRQRHSQAILRRLGLPELIAGDEDQYVEIAARLGTDPSWRQGMSGAIAARKSVLYDDPTPVAFLADWIDCVTRTR